MSERVRVRVGDVSDTHAVMALFDRALHWLVARDRTGQWGTTPFSTQPDKVQRIRDWAADGALWVAELGGETVGAIVLAPAPDYAPPATEPELYVRWFVTDRELRGAGIGAALLAEARAEAVRQGALVLRLDCWGGGDRALVRYYEGMGFTATEQFFVGEWEGQVLRSRI